LHQPGKIGEAYAPALDLSKMLAERDAGCDSPGVEHGVSVELWSVEIEVSTGGKRALTDHSS
jgi:hypothetical protein